MKFADLNIRKDLIEGLTRAGYDEAFAIQEHATPIALEGKDVIGKAQSGSGKTIAFMIPVIETVRKGSGVQALIIAPTRELTLQNEEVFKKIACKTGLKSVSVYGGKSINAQASALRSSEVVFATPGRLMDHMKRRNIDLRGIKIVVLDEADRMLDMGFINSIDYILRFTPCGRQTLLFSATMPEDIRAIVHRYMHDPVTVELDKEAPTVTTVDHEAWIALDGDKVGCLKKVLEKEKPASCLIFVQMKHYADRLQHTLSKSYNIEALHGDLSQAQRERVLDDFRSKKVPYLIATDVAARGLDIPQVSHVFNFDMPNDVETFIHRVGRTARAGAHGKAINIVLPEEINELAVIEHGAKIKIPRSYYRGSMSEEQAILMTDQLANRQDIIPKWGGKRTGMPGRSGGGGRGGFSRGGPRRGGFGGQRRSFGGGPRRSFGGPSKFGNRGTRRFRRR